MNSSQKERLRLIGVVGPTAGGKSTLVAEFVKRGYVALTEAEPVSNPYLTPAYQDIQRGIKPSENAFKSQLYFLSVVPNQIRHINQLLSEDEQVVFEIPHRMYAYLLFSEGFLDEKMYKVCSDQLDADLQAMPQPDIVFLTTAPSAQVLKKRIIARASEEPGREGEVNTPMDYWESQLAYWTISSELDKFNTMVLNEDENGLADWRDPQQFDELVERALIILSGS